MGTSDNNTLQSEEPSALSGNLTRQAWQALRDAANALAAVASAALGEGNFSVQNSPSLYTRSDAAGNRGAWPVTVIECVNDFLKAKARAGRSDRYLQALRVSLKSFAAGRATLPLAGVTVGEIEKWLDGNEWAARTKYGYLSDVRTLFNFAVRRGLVTYNPANAVELPVIEEPPPSLHTPEQVKRVLAFARSYNINICRTMAVRYFAGLRSSEADRLCEMEIRDNHIEVTAAKSKTRRRRLVTIQPNLREWLKIGGELPLRDKDNRLRLFTAALLEAEGVQWPHNVTRHSFVSYHLAHFQSAAKTALQAGHTEQILFNTYRELVTPEQAKAFWEIMP